MLPPNMTWLETIDTLPKLVESAIQYLGIKEIPGKANNPVIMDMAKGLGVSDIYTNDDLSWCALFVNHLIRINGKPQVDIRGDKYNLLRARWLSNWGKEVVRGQEKLGNVIVLKRDGGGHVCLWVAKTEKGFVGIGGNQGNKVSFAEFDTNRIIASRNYYSVAAPDSAKLYTIDSTGKLSTNEA